MKQIDGKQLEIYLRQEWEKLLVVIGAIVFVIAIAMGMKDVPLPNTADGSERRISTPAKIVDSQAFVDFNKVIPPPESLKGLTYTFGKAKPPPPPPPPPPDKVVPTVVKPPKRPTNAAPEITKLDVTYCKITPRKIWIDVAAKDAEGDALSWSIDFGDGNRDFSKTGWRGKNLGHVYKRDGDYTLILFCRDRSGQTRRLEQVKIRSDGVSGNGAAPLAKLNYMVKFEAATSAGGGTIAYFVFTEQKSGEKETVPLSIGEKKYGIELIKATRTEAVLKAANGADVILKLKKSAIVAGAKQ